MTVGLHVLNVGEMRLIQIDVHGVIVRSQRSSNELGRLLTQIVDYDVDFKHAFDFGLLIDDHSFEVSYRLVSVLIVERCDIPT